MSDLLRTVLYDRHVSAGAKMVEFGGWEMPVQYPGGILEEHLQTRRSVGLFDVSHMGRYIFTGGGALRFLQHVLTNNAAALEVGQAQYTMIANPSGGAVDDAYLYRFVADEYLLVVNAGNRAKDWQHFQGLIGNFPDVRMVDRSAELAMISLQGPQSRQIFLELIGAHDLSMDPRRNALTIVTVGKTRVLVGRTGYTGEPICFELFVPGDQACAIWDRLLGLGAKPVGLGARDTLRLEAGLPLYGHELGTDPLGKEIPIFACPLAKFAVSFSPNKGDFIGRSALLRQHEALSRFAFGDYSRLADLPRRVKPMALLDKAIARQGAMVYDGQRPVGVVTSGTSVPLWRVEGEGLLSRFSDEKTLRPICLALLDSDRHSGALLSIEVRGGRHRADRAVSHAYRSAPYARPVLAEALSQARQARRKAPTAGSSHTAQARQLLEQAVANTLWRQQECINLIPSEMTASPMVRLLSISDPAFRYAEHKPVKAFNDADIFYYQGVEFISHVETMLTEELKSYLHCRDVESRVISGQMANAVVFSAMVDYLNHADRRAEPRRIGCVMNNGIFQGGHLSAQPMGALKDYVARDSRTERPAVINFPVESGNPYRIDVAASAELIELHRPELIILGKSLVLHPEPVREIRAIVDRLGLTTVIMYDMAHVLGLAGPYFQEPFAEGADIVTGSTHKTFFGTQRGIVAGNFAHDDPRRELWEAIARRTFPGSVSNHHLGTLLGLLMATLEMNAFKEQYQPAVLANAKALAQALADCGMDVAGDKSVGYTQTHQVVVNVGYGKGPEAAQRLEESNIIVNYQAGPSTEGFSAAEALRLGVAEMTRFGILPADMRTIAELIRDVLVGGLNVGEQVKMFRRGFTQLQYCFTGAEFDDVMHRLARLV